MKKRKFKCTECETPCVLKFKDDDTEPKYCPCGYTYVNWKEVSTLIKTDEIPDDRKCSILGRFNVLQLHKCIKGVKK